MTLARFGCAGLAGLAALAATAAPAHAAKEDQELIKIAKKLKPIPDSQWHEIAGAKISDTYEIVKGDTLWDISKRLFGNAYYWPKVWALNGGITNPHIIEPGQKLVFTPGTSVSMPKLAPAGPGGGSPEASPSAPLAQADSVSSDGESGGMREYQKISKDLWVRKANKVPDAENYDSLGIDKELKISIPVRFSFRVPAIANDTTVPYLGEIVATRRDGVGIAAHDTVFLKSNSQDLQVGSSYTIFGAPEFVREKKADRGAYIYNSVGEVKVIGVRDDLYVGVITSEYSVVERGMKLYPLLPLVTDIKPLPGRTALESLVLMSAENGAHNTGQYRIIHMDRGIEDGVQVGNVFRIYDYFDPITKLKITDSDFLVSADALVIHATAQFSTALVIEAHETIAPGNFGVLLTDVSDFTKERVVREKNFGEEKQNGEDKELDELDELDKASGEGLGRKEESEIKELDQWDKSKDLQGQPRNEPTVPSAADTPTDEAEKPPGTEPTPAKKEPPQDPTLDQTLDSPTVTPPGLETPAPPAHLKPAPEQTLEAPIPPQTDKEPSIPGEPSPSPSVEPITPPESTPVEPALPSPPDDVRSQ